jgi:phosphoribosylformylglycinamidine cyclo-ligase
MKYAVDIEAGKRFVDRIKDKVPSVGGFNGMMYVPSGYEKPVLVSGADGVGTKVLTAGTQGNSYKGIGIDLVAMCVNDVITCGAQPLYFLDYISTGKIKGDELDQFIEGILEGCKISGMELIGGETAEHPRANGYDLAGFCTGIVEAGEIIDGSLIKSGDVVIGIESSGLHSNGYSLINDMLWRHKIFIKEMGEELLTPTTIYAPLVRNLLEEVPILGMAHITGGGIPENLPRCLPEGLGVSVNYNAWPLPEVFRKIMLAGEILEEDMKNTFNMGIGYCLVVPAETVRQTELIVEEHDLKSWIIGTVEKL